jgi:hypothetical protein
MTLIKYLEFLECIADSHGSVPVFNSVSVFGIFLGFSHAVGSVFGIGFSLNRGFGSVSGFSFLAN